MTVTDAAAPATTPGRPNRETRRAGRIALTVRVVLDPDTPAGPPLEFTVTARGADYFRAEEITGIDPWDALGELGNSSRVSNRFLKALHGLAFACVRRVAPTVAGDDYEQFLDRCAEVAVVGEEDAGDARPTDAGATSA